MKIPLIALPHRVTIIPFKGNGAYGPIWETDETKFIKNVPCLIETKITKTKDGRGNDIIQRAEGIFRPEAKIKINDKIKWEFNGQEYTVAEMTPVYVMGLHSIEVVMT